MRLIRHLFQLCLLVSALLAQAQAIAAQSDLLAQGRQMFETGVLANGRPLQALRADGSVAEGAIVACVNCHRASGMGLVEGDIQVSPIIGRFLFPIAGDTTVATMDPRIGKRMNIRRPAYTDEMLRAAITQGVGSDGRNLNVLMPRYVLSASRYRVLLTYLKHLNASFSPGIEDRTIRFATVITPGVSPARKQVFLQMLQAAIVQKNGSTVVRNGGRRHMASAAEMILGTENKWALDVWELKGPPESWDRQLQAFYRRRPPFALLSGLSETTWKPIEDFCERASLPSWFPSLLQAPVRDDQPVYSLYFSKGLTLEADVLAAHFEPLPAAVRVVQVYRASQSAAPAVAQLSSALWARGQRRSIAVDLDRLAPGDAVAQLTALGSMPDTRVVAWLGADDLAGYAPALAAAGPGTTYLSAGLLYAHTDAIPLALRYQVRMVYPYEIPGQRKAGTDYMPVWLKLKQIALVDEPLQSEVFFALNFMSDTLAVMLDNLYRDYLVERADTDIGQREARKAEDQLRDQNFVRLHFHQTPMVGNIPLGYRTSSFTDNTDLSTTIYPRLILGTNQRYASKGAYIVGIHKGDDGIDQIVRVGDWVMF